MLDRERFELSAMFAAVLLPIMDRDQHNSSSLHRERAIKCADISLEMADRLITACTKPAATVEGGEA